YKARNAAYEFLDQLNKGDWVALETFDLRPRIEVDFTRDKQEVKQALARMVFPGFTEANLFDALLDTLDRLQDVKGKKSIFILASGYDTFSKHTLDQTLKRVQQRDRKSTRLNSSHGSISYAVFCLKKKKTNRNH